MKLSMRWLSDYYTPKASIDDYISDMTMSGTKVEGYERENDNIEKVVVGKVLSVAAHPNADSLIICQIDVGNEQTVQIVTGATNVTQGSTVPVALHKSKLPSGTTIKKGKLRGELSEGMLCSLSELNLSKGDFPYAVENGIFLIEEKCNPGDPVDKALGLDDTIVEFEVTSNRPDCLSVIGLARESAATYGDKLTLPQIIVKGEGKPISEYLSVKVENTDLCKRYIGAVVESIKIEPSPRWLRERLRASGVRPINNIVDITNYVMIEYGQPMHAFDLRHVASGEIVVRNAKAGESITTLDGEVRELTEDMLVIADTKKPSAVAGVMGGEYSGIYDDTTTIILESACFDGSSVRRTAKKLGMRTESSSRFEKGLDSRNCELGIKRACELIEQLGAGTVANGFVDKDSDQQEPLKTPFSPAWINRLIGVEIPTNEMVDILDRLAFKVDGDSVVVPSFRRGDMSVPNDIAEEVIRIYSYDKIPTTSLRGASKGQVTFAQRFGNRISSALTAQGFSEIKTYSFYSPKNFDKIALTENDPRRNPVVIRNPLGEDTSILRTTAIPSMLSSLAYNYKNRNTEGSLFEVASIYLSNGSEKLPDEPRQIMLGQYGNSKDFYTLKGGIEALLLEFKVTDFDWVAVTDDTTFHPGRCANLIIGGSIAGIFGEVHPAVTENFEIGEPAYLAQLDYEPLMKAANDSFEFRTLPKFPASTRDLALVAGKTVTVGSIEKLIRIACGSLLESLKLFDVYEGAQIGENKKSVAYSLIFRADDRTLTDKECDQMVEKSLKLLGEIDVALRA